MGRARCKRKAEGAFGARGWGGAPFVFAGLGERGDQQQPPSFTILTTSSNAVTETIHDRMPVILSNQDSKRWFTPGSATKELLAPFIVPFPAERMRRKRVSAAFKSVRAKGASGCWACA